MFDSIEFAQPILQKIDELLIQKKRLLIAVDGRCAAGKTTLAAHIKDRYDCNVIPMDHFFPQSGQRTPERLREPGGNVDYERVMDEVMGPLQRGGDFTYRPYDCGRMEFGDAVTVRENKINVIEGSYSCHPALFDYYDLRVFLTVGPEEQSRRILERDGPDRAEDYQNKWIPYEESYFAEYDIEKRCDYCVRLDLEKGSATVTGPGAEPGAEPVAEPGAEPVTEPVAEPGVEPGAEPGAEPVTEPVAEPGEELDDPQNLCVECGKRERDLGINALSKLCGDCRREKIKLHIPPRIRGFLIVVSAFFLFSMIMFIPVLSDYRGYLDAGKHMQAREYTFAYKKYTAILDEYSYSMPLILKTAEAAASAQYFSNLTDIIDNHIMDKNLTDSEYEIVKEYRNLVGMYKETYDVIDRIFDEANETFTTYDDPALSRRFIQERLIELLEIDGIDRTQVYYMLGNASRDLEYSVICLEYACDANPRFTYPYAFYGNALRKSGEMGQAREVYQKAVELNACDALSWRGLGILDLLEGQKSRGLESIRHAYRIDRYTQYVADSLITALIENGLRDEAMTLLEQLVSEGFQFDERLQAYMDGFISLEEYYMG